EIGCREIAICWNYSNNAGPLLRQPRVIAMRRVSNLISICGPICAAAVLAAGLSGCARWVLPSNSTTTDSPFQNYRSAEDAYNRITPYVRTVQKLKPRALNPYNTPNIKVLNYLDLVPRFLPQQSLKQEDLDPAV